LSLSGTDSLMIAGLKRLSFSF